MNLRLPALLLLALTALSCQHKQTTIEPAPPPKDSLAVFQPYTVVYAGTTHSQNFDESSWFAPPFDTAYPDVLSILYPDSQQLVFRFAYWDVIRDNGHDALYYFKKDYRFYRNGTGYYLDSVRHNQTSFRIQGDSLIIDKYQIYGCCPGWQTVIFAGIRQ